MSQRTSTYATACESGTIALLPSGPTIFFIANYLPAVTFWVNINSLKIYRGSVLWNLMKYPLASRDEWYGDVDYQARGGSLVWMSPQEYLGRVRPLKIDDVSDDNIQSLVDHIQNGNTLDPLAIYADGKEDGRHRANAAIRLGIKKVPVLVFAKENPMSHDIQQMRPDEIWDAFGFDYDDLRRMAQYAYSKDKYRAAAYIADHHPELRGEDRKKVIADIREYIDENKDDSPDEDHSRGMGENPGVDALDTPNDYDGFEYLWMFADKPVFDPMEALEREKASNPPEYEGRQIGWDDQFRIAYLVSTGSKRDHRCPASLRARPIPIRQVQR